jgi:hypothetical protein
MRKNRNLGFGTSVLLAVLGAAAFSTAPHGGSSPAIIPANMPRIGTVEERFQSYNVEMVEVIGGRFWKPYSKQTDATPNVQPSARQSGANPVGTNAAIFQQRPPINLSNPRLRKLAAALGPAYMRVSGTWANTTYFQDSDAAVGVVPPTGFGGVLTREEWKGVVDFSRAANARIVTSFATSPGTRDASGVWTPTQARRLLAYTQSLGGSIAAAEFMNEPTFAAMGGAPRGYDAAAYGRDIAVFSAFIKQAAPQTALLGPGSIGEGGSLLIPMGSGMLKSEDLLKATGPVFDIFSYHFYGAVSQRCAMLGAAGQTTAAAALSEEWLARADNADTFYAGLRDEFEPGKPLWITETAEAACGGNPWASTFLDTFRYLDQHARLAKRGVQVIMHNTLASSDYGLLDENTLAPRPNYWAAWLWRKLMGTTVLDPGPSPAPSLHLYAQCLRDRPGGVALLVINLDRAASQSLELAGPAERYTLSANDLLDTTVQLNGRELRLGADDAMPELAGERTRSGHLTFAPATITFLNFPKAGNSVCR